jgi:methylmalonyl-CoA/ethylmalonyl-CoA epimerase
MRILMTESNAAPTGYRITQIGFAVDDVDATVRAYSDTFGWGPWRIYNLVPPRHHGVIFRGKPIESGVRVALAMAGEVEIELIQPLQGPGQFADFVAQHGQGLNHILIRRYDEDDDEVSIDVTSLGIPSLQSGNFGEAVGYNYLDGQADFATIIEIARGSSAKAGIPPDEVYPPNQSDG